MKSAIGRTLFFGVVAMFLWSSAPRLVSDFWHARDFVPAQDHWITKYKCTNWNFVMFNDCTVTFVSLPSLEPRQFTDWRFGRAPQGPVQLLQRRDDQSSVTTDVSLQTLWNRVLLALSLVLVSVFLAFTFIAKALKAEAAPIDAPSREPTLAPMARSTFGKRPA
jgi:hypothetical protein